MNIDIISLFPEMFAPLEHSIIKRAREKGILSLSITNPRDFSYNRHNHVDDIPFGGGAGMLLKPEPFFRAVDAIEARRERRPHIILMAPEGDVFSQKKARELSHYEDLIFICGHYEGFDHRIIDHLADECLSIGDYVLTGGELAAMVIIDALARMLPGVLGCDTCAETDSFACGLLEYPQYTRPRNYKGLGVPPVLLSGDHAKIDEWRQKKALEVTLKKRPDLLNGLSLSPKQKQLLNALKNNCD